MTQIDWSEVAVSDLPLELRELCEAVVGPAEHDVVHAAERIVASWGGGSVYIPALRDLKRLSLERRARRLFDPSARGGSGNYGEVCRALGVTRRHLRKLLPAERV